jgi:phosphate transport system substrate-binding protein
MRTTLAAAAPSLDCSAARPFKSLIRNPLGQFLLVAVVASGLAFAGGAPDGNAQKNPDQDKTVGQGPSAAHATIDSALPSYVAAQGVSGQLRSAGSDTMNNLVTEWFTQFKKFYPNVKDSVEGKGSRTAPNALIDGLTEFGAMSRPMKSDEVDRFEKKFGYKPTELRVAIDCLAVFVHKDAPIKELSLSQVRQLFSVDGKNMTWADLGVTDPAWATKPVALYGRNTASGTADFFRQTALNGRDFKPTVVELPGSPAVVQALATDRFGIGYSGVGFRTADVKPVGIKATDQDAAVSPTQEAAYDGTYALARPLLMYVNHRAGTDLDPLRAEFIRFVFSRQGQEAVVKVGEIPVPAEIAREELAKVGIKPTF